MFIRIREQPLKRFDFSEMNGSELEIKRNL